VPILLSHVYLCSILAQICVHLDSQIEGPTARPKCSRVLEKEQSMLPMKSLCTQRGLNCRYSTQSNLISFFYLPDVFIGRTFHWFQLLLQLQRLASLDISLLFESLDRFGQLAFFLLNLGQSFFYLFKFCQQNFSFRR